MGLGMKFLSFAICVMAVFTSAAFATESEDYVKLGAKSFSAFQCAALAATAGLSSEEKRLFKLGLDSGRQFLTAYQAGKVLEVDLHRGLPQGFFNLLPGPSQDFVLGRSWEVAKGWVISTVFKTDLMPDLHQSLAEDSFRSRNCTFS